MVEAEPPLVFASAVACAVVVSALASGVVGAGELSAVAAAAACTSATGTRCYEAVAPLKIPRPKAKIATVENEKALL